MFISFFFYRVVSFNSENDEIGTSVVEKVSYSRVLLAVEGTFGGRNLRGPNIQPIATTLIY
jgi:hypothetical protein